ncbi:MAG: Holliday junction resolvase RuvX [Selenomonadaceae bacterium]|nr:Holliday junction resolvase RuvX [Selenomonadaceae bacterium]
MTRAFGLDIGNKTIGLALSDPLGLTAQGLDTLRRSIIRDDLKRLSELIERYEIDTAVMGLPKNMNGTEGERCKVVRDFADKFRAEFPAIEIVFWDERLTTVAAQRALLEADVSRAKRKRVVDKLAAVFILQGYLDSIALKGANNVEEEK